MVWANQIIQAPPREQAKLVSLTAVIVTGSTELW